MVTLRVSSAIRWSGLEILLRHGLQFVVSVALARLLLPEEFGTIALLSIFIGIATTLVNSGFSAALVQSRSISQTDSSTVFWFNVSTALLMAGLLAAASPWIARFFEVPTLEPLAWLMAGNIVIASLGSIHTTLLTRELDFKTQLKAGALATVVSGAVAVFLAWKGFGVWALAVQALVSSTVTTVILWFLSSWRPSLEFSMDSAKRLFGFGGYIFAAGLLDTVYSRLYSVLVGKWFGARDLGYYNRADSTAQLPAGIISSVVSRVAFPVFSAASEDVVALRRGVKIATRGAMFASLPMMLGLAALADPLVYIIYGQQWLPSVPALRVLCLASLLLPLHVLNLSALKGMGMSRRFFHLEIAKKLVGIGVVSWSSRYGIMGVAWGTLAFGVIAFVLNTHYTKKYLSFSAADQFLAVLPVFCISAVMATVVFTISRTMETPGVLNTISLIILGMGLFTVLSVIFLREQLNEARELILGPRASATCS